MLISRIASAAFLATAVLSGGANAAVTNVATEGAASAVKSGAGSYKFVLH